MTVAPIFVPLKPYTEAEELELRCPGSGTIHACDFYVTGAEHGIPEPGGFRLGRILNVDHHAPHPRMEKPITSTGLAYEHLVAGGRADPASCVVIHHTDCDSILSSAMLLGHLPADPDLVAASVAADHTGEEHPVADILQALDEGRRGHRTSEQYAQSLHAVECVRGARPLGEAAQEVLDRRRMRRDLARELKAQGAFDVRDGVAFAVSDHSIDSAFFPAIVPEAGVIIVASPNVADPARWTIKLRLGESAPPGLTLHSLRITEWDPRFGGRWNAGSNGRGGGTDIPPPHYVEKLRASVRRATSELPD
jgi:hypothetical protein